MTPANTSTKNKIVDAAIATFIRYGARKTAMTDIADAAGVSRQTLYDQFGSKDDLVQAAIRRNTDLVLARIAGQLEGCARLSDRLDIYLAEAVVRTFERLQTSEDVEDLISGHSDAGRAAIAKSHRRHKELVVGLLSPHKAQIENTGQSTSQLAAFLVRSAMNLKHCDNRRELNGLLASLKISVLLAAAPELVQTSSRAAASQSSR